VSLRHGGGAALDVELRQNRAYVAPKVSDTWVRFSDEERVATRDGVQLVGRHSRQVRHRLARKRRYMNPPHGRGRKRAEHTLQRMIRRQLVVTEGEHDQRSEALDPTPHERQHVEGGTVRPMDVLDDPHRPPHPCKLCPDGLEQLGASARTQRLPERRRGLNREVVHRAERPRHEEVVAPAPDDPHMARSALRERSYKRGLADPGLAGDEHDRAGRPSRREAQHRAPRAGVRALRAPPAHRTGKRWVVWRAARARPEARKPGAARAAEGERTIRRL
jgi:hypothetical protein